MVLRGYVSYVSEWETLLGPGREMRHLVERLRHGAYVRGVKVLDIRTERSEVRSALDVAALCRPLETPCGWDADGAPVAEFPGGEVVA